MEKNNLTGFENMYTFRERKNKGNLENFFTELIGFMCHVSMKFRDVFINEFLIIDDKIELTRLIVTTQESRASLDEAKEQDIPDLLIYSNETEYKNNKPIILCEHKIESEIDNQQINTYTKSFHDVKFIKLITPKRPYYTSSNLIKVEHLFWEDLFKKIDSKFFNGQFYKLDSTTGDTELIMLYKFLEFMDWAYINSLNEEYFLYQYSSFSGFITKITTALDCYNQLLTNLKAKYDTQENAISELMTYIDDDIIRVSKKGQYNGFYLDKSDNLVQYRYNSNSKNEIIFNHNLQISREVYKNSVVCLRDFYNILKTILIDINNGLKGINIDEKSIKLDYINKNQLRMNYKINEEDHEFDIYFKNSTLIIDYDDNKVIELASFDFNALYLKLKDFIEYEKFSKK